MPLSPRVFVMIPSTQIGEMGITLGPFTNDVSQIFGIFDPLPPLSAFYSTKITQPPLTASEFGQPPPSPSLLTSFVNGPKGLIYVLILALTACDIC